MYLTESLVVAEYIAEMYGVTTESGNMLLPNTPLQRATMRLFMELCGPSSSFPYFAILRAGNDPEERETAIQSFQEGLKNVNAFLKHYAVNDGPFLFGQQFSLAECNMAPFVYRACVIVPAITASRSDNNTPSSQENVVDPLQMCQELGLDHLSRWIKAILERPSVVETSRQDDIMQGTRKMMERLAAMSTTTSTSGTTTTVASTK
jgi:glutathione S-transferase